MEVEALSTTTPDCFTSDGKRGSASDTRFCTLTWLMSPSVPLLNITVIIALPSEELDELM